MAEPRTRRALAVAGQAATRAATGVRRGARAAGTEATRRLVHAFSLHGPGFRQLALAMVGNTAGDTALAIALADTLFFSVPSVEARSNVALYLALTLAPFAVIGPLLGRIYQRYPGAYRYGLVTSTGGRAVLVGLLAWLGIGSAWVYPLAFGVLVLSRAFGIGRASLLPTTIPGVVQLVAANARLARLGILGSVAATPFAAGATRWAGPTAGLAVAAAGYVLATAAAGSVPAPPQLPRARPATRARETVIPRSVALARTAVASVRFLNGFLLLLLAFTFRDVDAPLIDFAAVLGAAGAGWGFASVVSPGLERRLREEPMVVIALALEAAAAFIGAQFFGLVAAMVLAASAGLAWGTAKLAFDGLLQHAVAADQRGPAFTGAETVFQLVWVVGALAPTVLRIPTGAGLAVAGTLALLAQVVFVSAVLVSVRRT